MSVKTGVNRRTIYKWLDQPEFQEAIKANRNKVVDGVVGRLIQAADKAISTLCQALKDEAPNPVRVRAADILISHLIRLREHQELATEVKAIQAQIETMKGGKA